MKPTKNVSVPIFCGLFHMICALPLHPSSDLLILFTENYAALSDQEKLDLVSSINEDSHWLLNMVENLLSITRIQGDTGRVRKEDELVEEVVSEAITRIKKRIPDIEIHVTAPDNILIIPMDPLLIEQVLMNLIENAFCPFRN